MITCMCQGTLDEKCMITCMCPTIAVFPAVYLEFMKSVITCCISLEGADTVSLCWSGTNCVRTGKSGQCDVGKE